MNVNTSPANHIANNPQVNPAEDFVFHDSIACGKPQNANNIEPIQPSISMIIT